MSDRDFLRSLPNGSLTRTEVGILLDDIATLEADNAVLRGIVQRYWDGWDYAYNGDGDGHWEWWRNSDGNFSTHNTLETEPMSPAERAMFEEDHK